jgi:hypothetical protein
MTRIATARNRVEQADSLIAVLDAAHDAFEDMLSVTRVHEDPEDGMFIPLVMAAASAADGRDAIAFAPSLPPRRIHPATAGKQPHEDGPVQAITSGLAALSELLARRLTEAARSAPIPADQTACTDAARSARDIQALLAASEP